MICGHCKKECGIKVVDEGIGGYEYWGATGTHHDYVCYSDCCEDIIEDEDGNEISQTVLMRQAEEDAYDDYYPDYDEW